MEEKLGVFICSGYGIAEALDVEALREVATGECGVPLCVTVETCEGDGLRTIIEQAEAADLRRIVIAGISARAYTKDPFPPNLLVERLALRELVVWCQPAGEEETQSLAEDYLRMAIARVRKSERPDPFRPDEPVQEALLVVGGGITGLTAALEAARAGYQVHLVERTDRLGGWLARQHRVVPTRAPFLELEDPGVDALVAEVQQSPLITVHLQAATAAISGAPGMFDVTLEPSTEGAAEGAAGTSFRVGAVVQATGWRPADPREDLPYGGLEDVIRNVELEEIVASQGRICRPSDGKPVQSIAFIQCGGARHAGAHSYCSSICCLTSLKQCLYLRAQDDAARAYIFYDSIRTPGQYEDFYRRVQEDPGVLLTRGEVTDVQRDAEGGLLVTARDTLPARELQVKVDLVVLAAGMVPNAADGEAIRELEEARSAAVAADSPGLRERAAETARRLQRHEGTAILNLTYRQGPDLPMLDQAFPDSHFICFPYETRRTGVYTAGCVRQPMDGISSREDAAGAAMKAIQCIEMTARGEAVHPRAGDRSHPSLTLERCTQCKRCTEECPFGGYNEDDKGTPLPWETRCRRCGICLGACPERIISFQDYSVEIISAMINAVEVPDEFEEQPRVLALLCENDAYPALEAAARRRLRVNPHVRVIPVRCLGSVNPAWIREAISCGFDGVLLVGCTYGEDYQCHFVKGSELASTRADNFREALVKMSMEDERVQLHQLQIAEPDRLVEILGAFEEVIEEHGMNPFKGM